jgi:hypothetical protein
MEGKRGRDGWYRRYELSGHDRWGASHVASNAAGEVVPEGE